MQPRRNDLIILLEVGTEKLIKLRKKAEWKQGEMKIIDQITPRSTLSMRFKNEIITSMFDGKGAELSDS